VPRIPTEERIENGSDEARWDLGPVRLDPRAWLRGPTFNDNVFSAADDGDKVSDVTGTVGAGLVGFTNLGSDVIVSAYFLPSYTWWQDQDQLSESQLNFGAGVFGFYNRVTLMADARRDERQRFLSSEVLVPFDVRSDRARLRAEVDLRGPFDLFGSVELEDLEHTGDAVDNVQRVSIDTLDRDEMVARLGAGYRFSSGLRLGLGIEYSEADFTLDPAGRSNTSFGPLLEIAYDGDEVDAAVTLVFRDIDFEGLEESSNEPTGSGRVGWQANHRVRLDLYGGRSLVYSVRGADRYFIEDRLGLSAGSPWGRRIFLRAYVETGTDDFESLTALPALREDDVTSLGGEINYEVNRRLSVGLGATRSDHESNLPGLDRTVTVWRLGLQLGGDHLPW
jgi:hypothetical protein